jgi:hypothetical protein
MSLNQPSNKEELKDFCLRQLGSPVIQINVDDEQVNDAVELAFEYWNEFHFNGTERTYLKYQVTEEDKSNGYITMSQSVIGATRIFPVGGTAMAMGMFDLRYQLRLNDLWDLSSTSYVNYGLTMQHLRTLDMMFSGETPVSFNRITNRLYIHWDWKADIHAGEWIVVEGYIITDPTTYTAVWNDRMLKKLTTAYIKKQWGANMGKFDKITLPGGVVLRGGELFAEAVNEIALIEQNIRDTYEAPPTFLVG